MVLEEIMELIKLLEKEKVGTEYVKGGGDDGWENVLLCSNRGQYRNKG